MKLLYLIPARGGSKGIPGKNIKDLGGRPLIDYTLEAANKAANGAEVCVSTDSKEIKAIVEGLGYNVPFIRPKIISGDEASSESVIMHALDFYKQRGQDFDFVVLLQPTSPFRKAGHILSCIDQMDDHSDMVVSVKVTDVNPYYVLFEESEDGYLVKSKKGDFSRRQDCPMVYELNGAIYIIRVSSFQKKRMKGLDKIIKYEMNKWDSVDVDDPFDWLIAEEILKKVIK